MASIFGKFNQKQERPLAKTAPLPNPAPAQPIQAPAMPVARGDDADATRTDLLKAMYYQQQALLNIDARLEAQSAALDKLVELVRFISVINTDISKNTKR